MTLRIDGFDNSPRSIGAHDKHYRNTFTINGTSAPDGIGDEDLGTFARTGAGIFTLTFPSTSKPVRVLAGHANIDQLGQTAHYTGYNASTGVATFKVANPGIGTAAVCASGTVTCVAKASMADSDYITIGDGINAAKLYEFDTAGDGVTGGRVQVNISTDTSATDVAARLVTAINANQLALSAANVAGVVTVTHKIAGTVGNVTITENVANAGFLVTGMSGGAAAVADAAAAAETDNAVVTVFLVYEN
jgi:hypothetical protein